MNIETVPVGNPGNAGELSGLGAGGFGPNRICGAVDYEYRIGKHEVTAGQYCVFLNKVAATDTHGLYRTEMVNTEYGSGISRSGLPGSYTYSVAADMADVSGNNAKYYTAPYTYPIDPPYDTTVVGEFQNSHSPYRTFDQGGNILE